MTQTQDLEGNWVEATPLAMTCEYKNCKSHEGKDYERKGLAGFWTKEPIFLCENHSDGYTLYTKEK